jgi:hypothetical protein
MCDVCFCAIFIAVSTFTGRHNTPQNMAGPSMAQAKHTPLKSLRKSENALLREGSINP